MEGTVNLVGTQGQNRGREWGDAELARRSLRPDLSPDPNLPADTRLWAALQDVSGGTWGGCVYDVDRIIEVLTAGKAALGSVHHHEGGMPKPAFSEA